MGINFNFNIGPEPYYSSSSTSKIIPSYIMVTVLGKEHRLDTELCFRISEHRLFKGSDYIIENTKLDPPLLNAIGRRVFYEQARINGKKISCWDNICSKSDECDKNNDQFRNVFREVVLHYNPNYFNEDYKSRLQTLCTVSEKLLLVGLLNHYNNLKKIKRLK